MAAPVYGSTAASANNPAGTSFSPTLPASYNTGDLLWAYVTCDGIPTVSTSSTGWTKLVTNNHSGGLTSGHFFVKMSATGSDTLTLSIATAQEVTVITGAVSGHDSSGTILDVSNNSTSNSTTPDPASISLDNTKEYLVIACMGANTNVSVSSGPSGYTSPGVAIGGATAWDTSAIATKQVSFASSEDPGNFTISASRVWITTTIAIPAAAGTTISSTTGEAAGAATISGQGQAIVSTTGAAAGSSTASGQGVAIKPTTGSATAGATVSGQGAALVSTTGASAGVGAAAGASIRRVISTGASAAVATVSGTGSSTATATGASAAVASVSGSGVARKLATGASAGVASVSGVAGGATVTTTGSADGSAAVSGQGITGKPATGASAGVGAAAGQGVARVISTGASAGVAAVAGSGGALKIATGASAAVATVAGSGVAAVSATGDADGAGAAAGQGAALTSTTGDADGSSAAAGVGVAGAPTTGAAAGVATVSGAGGTASITTITTVGDSDGAAQVAGLSEAISSPSGAWAPPTQNLRDAWRGAGQAKFGNSPWLVQQLSQQNTGIADLALLIDGLEAEVASLKAARPRLHCTATIVGTVLTLVSGFSLTSIPPGVEISFIAPAANAGPLTATLDGLALGAAQTVLGGALPAGYLISGSYTTGVYSGSSLLLNRRPERAVDNSWSRYEDGLQIVQLGAVTLSTGTLQVDYPVSFISGAAKVNITPVFTTAVPVSVRIESKTPSRVIFDVWRDDTNTRIATNADINVIGFWF